MLKQELREFILERYQRRTKSSHDAFRSAQRAIVGGVNRGILQMDPYPLFLQRGEGPYVWDLDGNKYTDFNGNYSSLIMGHCNPDVLNAVTKQAKLGSAWSGGSTAELDLATLIRDRSPSIEGIRFSASGTEATMLAIRAARAYTGRTKLVKFEGSYHGSHDYAAIGSVPRSKQAGSDPILESIAPSGIPRTLQDTVLIVPFNDPDAIKYTLNKYGSEIAAVIVEPVMGVAGVIAPENGFLGLLRELTDEYGIVLIFDEVISFRIAYGGAQSLYGVKADLVTLGKIIGGGYSIGAVGGRSEVMKVFDPSQKNNHVSFSGTFHGNPISLAAGIATLTSLTHEKINQLNDNCALLMQQVQEKIAALSVPLHIQGVGSVFNIHASSDSVSRYQHPSDEQKSLLSWLNLALINEGIILSPRGFGCLSVPMTKDDTCGFASSLERSIEAIGAVSS